MAKFGEKGILQPNLSFQIWSDNTSIATKALMNRKIIQRESSDTKSCHKMLSDDIVDHPILTIN